MDLSKCQCEKAGFCPAYKKDMSMLNWRWCQSTSEQERINLKDKYQKTRNFAIIIPSYNEIGGVETWLQCLSKHFYDHIDALCTININPDSSINKLNLKVMLGKEAAIKICSTFNTVLFWGEQNIDQYLIKGRPQRLVFVHHGSLDSTWAEATFSKQVPFAKSSKDLIAVNKQVSQKYNCQLIENFIDLERCSNSYSPENKTILWAHRISKEKRPLLFIKIAKNMPDYDFIICGEGDMKQKVLSLMPKNCTYMGCPHDLKDIFQKVSVFVSTADQEAFGYSVGEAIASDIPVVSCNVGLGKDYADISLNIESDIEVWVNSIKSCLQKKSKHKERLLKNYNMSKFINSWGDIIKRK